MRKNQKGFVTLAVVLILLMLSTLGVLHASKTLFFAQKTANNTYHYGQAMAAAQAGVEQGLAFLDNTKKDTLNRDDLFDSKKLELKADRFPIAGSLPNSRSTYQITMTQPNATDPYLILISSRGCADGGGSCVVQANVSQLVKFRKAAMHAPDDALLTRGKVGLGGSSSVQNGEGHGVGVRAGGSVGTSGSSKITGNHVQHDSKLKDTSADVFFEYFFGADRADMKAQLPNFERTFPPSGTVGGAYWIEGDTAEHGGTYGSPSQPVVLIVNGNLQVNANTVIYGFVYVVGGGIEGWENSGGGKAQIIGAAVSEASFSTTGNLDISKDSDVLKGLGGAISPAKVAGSWKDF